MSRHLAHAPLALLRRARLGGVWCVVPALFAGVSCGSSAPEAVIASPVPTALASIPSPPTVAVDRGAPSRPRHVDPKPPPKTRLVTGSGFTLHPCEEEGRLRSQASTESLVVDITNRTEGAVFVEWLDFQGRRVRYMTLPAADGYEQQTFVTHPWIFVDEDQRCIGIAVPTSVDREITQITIVRR